MHFSFWQREAKGMREEKGSLAPRERLFSLDCYKVVGHESRVIGAVCVCFGSRVVIVKGGGEEEKLGCQTDICTFFLCYGDAYFLILYMPLITKCFLLVGLAESILRRGIKNFPCIVSPQPNATGCFLSKQYACRLFPPC